MRKVPVRALGAALVVCAAVAVANFPSWSCYKCKYEPFLKRYVCEPGEIFGSKGCYNPPPGEYCRLEGNCAFWIFRTVSATAFQASADAESSEPRFLATELVCAVPEEDIVRGRVENTLEASARSLALL